MASHPTQAASSATAAAANTAAAAQQTLTHNAPPSSSSASPSSNYFLLSDLNKPVRVKLNSLRGRQGILAASPGPSRLSADLARCEYFLVASLYCRGLPLALPCSSPLASFVGPSSDQVKFTQWVQFPVKYKDLSPTARIAFTAYEVRHNANTGQTQEIIVGGTSFPLFSSSGLLKLGRRKLKVWPGVAGDGSVDTTTPHSQTAPGENTHNAAVELLERRIREYDQKELPCVKWLDKLALRRIERIQQAAMANHANPNQTLANFASTAHPEIILSIEFPAFHHPIVYHQKTCNPPLPTVSGPSAPVFVLFDSQMARENPIENKYHKLARASKGLADRDLKPKIAERKELQAILSSPNKRLAIESKELLWKFRFILVEDKRALTKFLRAVNWSDLNETRQALELLEEWSAPDIADSLELLCAYFTNEGVRIYAVKQLQRADDEELSNYLLQLVQALRYENSYPSSLSQFLIDRALKSFSLCNFFHWYVTVELSDARKGHMFSLVHSDFMKALGDSHEAQHRQWKQALILEGQLINSLIEVGDAARSRKERVDKKIQRMRALLAADGDFRSLRSFEPVHLAVKPEVRVCGIVGDECTMFKSALTPMLVAFNTVADKSTDPAASPAPAAAASPGLYKVIFKRGDDLRQDQLVIQMINLMDSLFKKVKLDLQLTPYRVLATGATDGFVEYVPGTFTLTSILDQYSRSISDFFHRHHHSTQAINRVLDTFVKSSAGYCIITYILGIGDRHLDNVLLTANGNMIHIDFSFLFGRDPKPFPPPMKFSKEMVEAMGGADSEKYLDFQKYCVLAFNILRQHANLILNLLSLMGDANIPDLSNDVEKNLLKVQEKFRLDLNDEEAGHYILSLIDQSVSALFPQVMEKFHRWALYWK